MENKINIAELLKDCPKGMELDCTIYNNVTLGHVVKSRSLPICISIQNRGTMFLSRYGQLHDEDCCKCVIFPKGKTTWEGFVPPCKFKDGDIIFTHANCLEFGVGNTWISIYQENRNGGVATYVDYAEDGSDYYSNIDGDKAFLCFEKDILRQRLATEEEKQKLFDAIKANGYKWNAETKTLEKLVEPKFKAGDKIKIESGSIIEIEKITDYYYISTTGWRFYIKDQDKYELVPNKFDISTLKPFESKVLVRDKGDERWSGQFFSHIEKNSDKPFVYIGVIELSEYRQCIPYEGNEHLLNTTNDCEEYYKTW